MWHHTIGLRRTRRFRITTVRKAMSIHIPAKLARSRTSHMHNQSRRHNRSQRQRLQYGTNLKSNALDGTGGSAGGTRRAVALADRPATP